MRISLTALFIFAAALPAMAQDISGAQQASQRFTAAMSGGDSTTAASLFADDAVALPPGRDAINGKSEIQRFLGNMSRSVKDLKYTSEDLKPIGDATAREVGSFSFEGKKQGAAAVTGKYLIIWTKAGSDWKIAADMWNRSGGAGGGKARQGGKSGGGEAPDVQ